MRGYCQIVDPRRKQFFQVKAKHIAPRAYDCLCVLSLSFVIKLIDVAFITPE